MAELDVILLHGNNLNTVGLHITFYVAANILANCITSFWHLTLNT